MADPLAVLIPGTMLLAIGLLYALAATRAWPLLGLLLGGVVGGMLGGSAAAYYTSSIWIIAVVALLLGVGLAVVIDHLAEAGLALNLALLIFVLWFAASPELRSGTSLLYLAIVACVVAFSFTVAGSKFVAPVVFATVGSISSLLGIVLVGAYLDQDWSSTAMVVALLVLFGGLAVQWFDLREMGKQPAVSGQKRPSSVISAPPRT